MRYLWKSASLAGLALVCAASLGFAQTGFSTPAPNSPAVILGFLKFHTAVADQIKNGPAKSRDALASAARKSLGVSEAEFGAVTRECQNTLAGYRASSAVKTKDARTATSNREQILQAGLARILAGLSAESASNLTAYMNGPFRSSIRSVPAQGGAK